MDLQTPTGHRHSTRREAARQTGLLCDQPPRVRELVGRIRGAARRLSAVPQADYDPDVASQYGYVLDIAPGSVGCEKSVLGSRGE
ncbi:hypothetical protein A4G27_15580 [Mycobacterium kansasii]|nr:hypothetical protein A4G27_15580 [Mycobacterium kansasii]